jgi:hypothetical protein
MPYEILNTKRSKSTIRVTGNTATRVNLTSLSTDQNTEVITGATITHVMSTTDGFWKVYRGNDNTGTLVLDLAGNNDYPLVQYDIVVANTPTANIYVTNSGAGGTLILSLSKTATFTPPLTDL